MTGALALAEAEPGTVDWYAARTSPTTFWIFDTFGSEDARQAHLKGEIAAALMAKADELLASPPEILAADVLARKWRLDRWPSASRRRTHGVRDSTESTPNTVAVANVVRRRDFRRLVVRLMWSARPKTRAVRAGAPRHPSVQLRRARTRTRPRPKAQVGASRAAAALARLLAVKLAGGTVPAGDHNRRRVLQVVVFVLGGELGTVRLQAARVPDRHRFRTARTSPS